MSLCRHSISIAILVVLEGAFASGAQAANCKDPTEVAAVLRGIEDRDWETISGAEIKKLWPTEFNTSSCNAGACQSIDYGNWETDGIPGCFEGFTVFDGPDDFNSPPIKGLSTIVLQYVSMNTAQAVNTVRMYSLALGLSEFEANRMGRKPAWQYQWSFLRGNRVEARIMHVGVGHAATKWRAYVYLSRNTWNASAWEMESAHNSKAGVLNPILRLPWR